MPETGTEKSTYGRNETLRQPGSSALWWRWVLATSVGLVVGAIVGSVAAWPIHLIESTLRDIALGDVSALAAIPWALAGAVGGAMVGFAQWLVLRRYIHNVARRQWMLATAVGGLLGLAIIMVSGRYGWRPFVDIIGPVAAWLTGWMGYTLPAFLIRAAIVAGPVGAVGGAMFGFPQWLVLRYYVHKAGWWVLASAVPWGVCVPVAWVSPALMFGVGDVGTGLLVIVLGGVSLLILPGVTTGIALVWLLRTPLSPSGKQTV